jgi:hypothetical protein
MIDINKRSVALVIDEVLGAPEHFILGVKKLGKLLGSHSRWASHNNAWNATKPEIPSAIFILPELLNPTVIRTTKSAAVRSQSQVGVGRSRTDP